MVPPLTDDDLAYMRETQAEHRPTPANLIPRSETPDGMGGTTTTQGDPQPIQVRLDGDDEIPQVLADRWGPNVIRVTLDLVDVTAGDLISLSPTEAYQVVSHGDPDRWATAQAVYALRTVWP